MESGKVVPLRRRRAAMLRFFAAALAFAAFVGFRAAGEPAETIVGLVGITLVACLFIFLRKQFCYHYEVRGRVLVVWSPTSCTEIDLPTVADIDLRAGYQQAGRSRSATLLLILDDVQIVLGDKVSGLRFDSPGRTPPTPGPRRSGFRGIRTGRLIASVGEP